jgi:hypothetical protein
MFLIQFGLQSVSVCINIKRILFRLPIFLFHPSDFQFCTSIKNVVGSLDVWFSDYFQICWDLQKSCLWLTSIAPVVTDFPRVVSIFALRSCYWILMGRLILLRDRELVFSNNFMGWVGVFSGTWKYLFWCLFSVFRLYTAPRLCSYFYSGLCPSCAETWLLIYLLLKKNSFRHT